MEKTVPELIEAKKELDSTILNLLNEFERQYKIRVYEIEFITIDQELKPPITVKINCLTTIR